MKTTRILLLLAVALAGAWRLAAFDKNGPRVEVNYLEPEKFTDVRDSYPEGTDAGREATLAELRKYLVGRADKLVPAGQKLRITITDVDLAGDFEPWLGPRWADVRIVKDLYPPAISLAFQLVDERGQVLKSGKRELRDLAFLMKLTMGFRDDPLRHEKALLDDWLSLEFREPKAG
ncbi:MAG: DUF3016 domain-containing protein [Verrucomicrobia bacterium]|nr:DUF3016 domain-containing protein [Verrucomicrobiota bacterium]